LFCPIFLGGYYTGPFDVQQGMVNEFDP